MDFIGPISEKNQKFYILLSMDRFSKWPAASLCKTTDGQTATKFLEQLNFLRLNSSTKFLLGQKCLAAIDILLMAGCPLWRRLIIVFCRFFGTIILSSKNTNPYLVESFLLYMVYSSGMLSCCWRSRHTSVFRRLGSFVVSDISYWRSVEKFFSVSLTAFPRSQLFCSSASTLGAWPIFMYWTLLTPTYLAQLMAGTSRTDGSWSVSDPISPSSIGAYSVIRDDVPGCSCGRCGRSSSQNGSTVHCSFSRCCGWNPCGLLKSLKNSYNHSVLTTMTATVWLLPWNRIKLKRFYFPMVSVSERRNIEAHVFNLQSPPPRYTLLGISPQHESTFCSWIKIFH